MKKYMNKFISLQYKNRSDIIRWIVLSFTEKRVLLLSNPVDYTIDWYMLIRNKDIVAIRRGERERFFQKVIQYNFWKKIYKSPLWENISYLKQLKQNLAVCSFEKKKDDSCRIWSLDSIQDWSLHINELSSKAIWWKKSTIKIKKVKVITRDSHYINSLVHYSKSLQ